MASVKKKKSCLLSSNDSNKVNDDLMTQTFQVAQLVEHRAVAREVVSSTLVRPTLRVLK